MSRLEGKVAVITGSGAGLGAEAARLFAREGCAVVVSDMETTAGEQVVGEIKAAGGKAVFIAADVRSTAQVEALYAG
ncbi:MAG: SDR family NAD(P)-dependent oxidoreductase, partial [Gemmatimonadota bacterium]|nr:SDR family NAD(P)-dependent oxidoreductase [Gemmatimonadota bacterium]